MTRVFFVRHAQSDWKSGTDRERGLTGEGREDAGVVLPFFKDKGVDRFYCSPYRRSLDTIRESADFYGQAIQTDERLREREAAPGGNCYGRILTGRNPAGSACAPCRSAILPR